MSDWRILTAGAAIGVSFVALRRLSPGDGSPLFFALLGVASIAYLAAVRELYLGRGRGRAFLLCALTLALLWRLPLALAPVGSQADVHRYVWDARVQRAGLNPYTARPSDPALDGLHTPATRAMNNMDVPSPYPPVAQLYFRAVTGVHESAEALKVSLVVCEGLLVLVLWRWLVGTGRNPALVLVYAWHPLATLEIARNGHFDVLGAFFLCLSALALTRRRQTLAAACLALAIGTKLLPLVLAPLYLGRVRARHALGGMVLLLAAAVPFVREGLPGGGSLPAVVAHYRFNAPLFTSVASLVGAWGAVGIALAAGLAASAWWRRGDVEGSPAPWAWPLAATLVCSPLVYPWYLVWLVPFATRVATLPLLAWSLSTMVTYGVWHAAAAGAPWRVPTSLLLAEYLPPALIAGYLWWRRGSPPPQPRTDGLPVR